MWLKATASCLMFGAALLDAPMFPNIPDMSGWIFENDQKTWNKQVFLKLAKCGENYECFFFFTFSECLSVGVFPLFCPPPGFSAVSGGSISREDDGSFWQPVSSLLHDLTGPIRALRHLIPSMAAGEQEGEGWGWDGSLGGQRSSPGAEGFSSSSSSHSICLFLRREPGRFGQFFSWFVTFSPSSEKQLCDSLFLFWLDVMWRCWLLNNNGFASSVRRICQAQFPTLLSSPAIKTSTVRPASSPLILLLVVLLFSGSVRPPPVGSSSLI